jgi:hypothetical protein
MIPERCAACAAQVSFAHHEKPDDAIVLAYMLGFASGLYSGRTGRGALFCPLHGAEMHKILIEMGAQIDVEFMTGDKPS